VPRDPEKAKARQRRYRERRKVKKFGAAASGSDMRGRHGQHAQGDQNARWNSSGRLMTSHGYVAVRAVDESHPRVWGHGYMYEHHVVAEEMLGRRLEDGEVVHHKNGQRDDNRPENLAVETMSEHAR
jgi:hypothetical protein